MRPMMTDSPAILPAHHAALRGINRLDAEDMARTFTSFRAQPLRCSAVMRFARSPADGDTCAYTFDAQTAIVYVVE